MKLDINRELLLPGLQKINNVIEKRQTMPILSNVLINATEQELILTGTDLEIEIVTKIETTPTQAGQVTVPARKFLDICRLLPENSNMSIELKNDKVQVVSGSARFLLASLPAEHYPEFSSVDFDYEFNIKAGNLKYALDKTLFCMANQDVRYYLNGLFLNISNKRIKLVASDGHRLAIFDDELEQATDYEVRIIIPRKGVQELSRLLDDPDADVRVQFSGNNIRFTYLNVVFSAKLVDAKYPDFNRVFEQDFHNAILIDKMLLKNALTRVSILSNEKFKGITLTIEENKLNISTHNQENDEAEEALEMSYVGEPLSISFNSQYLLDAISNLDSDSAEILLAANLSTCFVVDPSRAVYKFIVMPMKL